MILYPEAQNYENRFKVGGSQTPGLSSKSQVNKATCRCSTGYSQIWWHLLALHPQVTWSQCSGVPGSRSQWRGDAVGCKADPASSWSSFIENNSWAYSYTGSFCINWGNLSEGCYLLDVCRLTDVAGFSVRAAVKLAAGNIWLLPWPHGASFATAASQASDPKATAVVTFTLLLFVWVSAATIWGLSCCYCVCWFFVPFSSPAFYALL